VMSYGAQADAIVTVARRDQDAAASDQVLAVLEKADYTLTPTLAWETLGMRGTCSAGFALKAGGDRAQVLAEPYAIIHAHTMTPTAHLLWSGVWAGIAAAASERAQKFLRKAARKAGGQLPPGAPHYTRATTALRTLQGLIHDALADYEARAGDAQSLTHVDFQTRITLLKVEVSELAVSAVMSAMRACGLSGYRNDGEASIGRLLRDVLSAPIMINNDRILANLGASALLSDIPRSLTPSAGPGSAR
jgi:acyl-CoA dehydrogenase